MLILAILSHYVMAVQCAAGRELVPPRPQHPMCPHPDVLSHDLLLFLVLSQILLSGPGHVGQALPGSYGFEVIYMIYIYTVVYICNVYILKRNH